ncbi:MAG TPA: pyridoxal-dependent decarboxylase, partial [candidate division Zixibacteria bacterium]|nr:pyridoxal-dependent decarboxylase [candidate division Zixibacteria bacterium]
MLKTALEESLEYRKSLDKRRVFPDQKMLEKMQRLDFPLPKKPSKPEKVLKLLSSSGSAGTVAVAGPRYFGFVIGGSTPVTLAANWLAGAWDQNCGMDTTSPVAAFVEEISLKWLLELYGFPKTCGGAFVTGATMAGFTCLAAARSQLLNRQDWNVEKKGLFGAPEINVIVSEEAHVTILKAFSMLGMGNERVTKVPTDQNGRMLIDKIPRPGGPTIICVQAGDVNSGCFDPIDEIISNFQSDDVWIHVDGAFGLWVLVTEKYKHLGQGIEKADSWSVDAHKWLNVPYDSGIALVKNAEALRNAMSVSTAYLKSTSGKRQPNHYTPELSRRARGIEIWTAIASLGRQGIAEIVERCCAHAQYAAKRLADVGYKILNEVVVNQVLVSF